MTFYARRVPVRISVALLPLIAFCIVAGELRRLLLAILSLALHEVCHAIAAKNAGFPVTGLEVWPFGAVMRLDGGSFGKSPEWTVAAAGPIGSLMLAAMLRLSAALFGQSETVEELFRTNLAIALLNLLPAYPLDGGRIVRSVLLRITEENTAKAVLLAVTALTGAVLIGLGVFLAYTGTYAWTLLFVPPFLIASAVREYRNGSASAVVRVMERRDALKNGEAQRAVTVAVSDGMTVGQAMSLLSARRYTVFRVQGETGARELDETVLLDAAAKFGRSETLKSVILRLTGG